MNTDQFPDWAQQAAAQVGAAVQHLLANPTPFIAAVVDNWAFRTMALLLLVLVTIRAIAAVYGGDVQNARRGPIAFRVHVARALQRQDIRLPSSMMPMNLDGVRANAEIFYTYTDRRGRRRSVKLHTIDHAAIRVTPGAVPKVANTIVGQEITPPIGALKPEDVVIPAGDVETTPDRIEATPETVADYVRINKVLEAWTEDDAATLVSVHQDEFATIQDARESFIIDHANELAKARAGGFWSRGKASALAQNAPSVIGSYYIRFRLSRDPIFILTRHPDRDLKMTAWLTVLTSLFAMVMEAWPLKIDTARAAPAERAPIESRARAQP